MRSAFLRPQTVRPVASRAKGVDTEAVFLVGDLGQNQERAKDWPKLRQVVFAPDPRALSSICLRLCDFPLLVLKENNHYWKYVYFFEGA